MTVQYVLGFARSPKNEVALIRKNRPNWQAGKLNGIGGHIEEGETPLDAMSREFREETGVNADGWQFRGTLTGDNKWLMFVFIREMSQSEFDKIESMTDEMIDIFPIETISRRTDIIPNLRWLISLSFDHQVSAFSIRT